MNDEINVFAYPWMRAQVMAHLFRWPDLAALVDEFSPSNVSGYVKRQGGGACPYHQRLARQIVTLGFDERRGLALPKPASDDAWSGRISVAWSHDGRLILNDGLHRLVALLIAGANHAPAVVDGRHPEWSEFMREAMSVLEPPGERLYTAIPHPEFARWTANRQEHRTPYVVAALESAGAKSVLDFGCHTGVLTCEVAPFVERIHGADTNAKALRVAEWLRGLLNLPNATFSADGGDGPIDAVLALSVLHHLPDPLGMARAWRARGARLLIVELPRPHEPMAAHQAALCAAYEATQAEAFAAAGWAGGATIGVDATGGACRKVCAYVPRP